MLRLLLVSLTLLLAAAPASAQLVNVLDYVGFAWEDGGLPPSNPGDVLQLTAVTDYADPILGLDLVANEVTFYAYDLVSTGEVPDGGGNTVIGYVGGMLDVYVDPAKNADWGVLPPNATSPSTFSDGLLLFRGSFQDFRIILTPAGAGVFEGTLDGIAGTLLSALCSGCAYTWGGAWTADVGAQIPDGYDLQIDGSLEVDEAIPNQTLGWGALKALY